MSFDALLSAQSVFLDANCFLYYLTAHPRHGPACKKLLDRIEAKDLIGLTSAHVLHEVIHRLMTIEACQRFTWPVQGIARRLRRHPAEVQQFIRPRQAVDEIALIGLDVLSVGRVEVSVAVDISCQTGLLAGDALIVALMEANGLTNLASNDADFDRVPGLTRYGPV